jgi:signal peptidase II
VLVATAVLVLALDVVSKVLVVAKLMHRDPVKLPGDFLWLVHARNPGAAFSFAEGATVVFTAVAAIVIAVIVRTASRLRSVGWAISLGLVLGGAAGNLIDRLFRSPAPLRGWVVDWISLRSPDGRMLFPIFNLADSGIVCGGILAVLLAILGYEMDGTRGGKDTPAPAPTADLPPGHTPPSADPTPRTATPPPTPFRGSAPGTPFRGSAPGTPFPGSAPGTPFPGSASGTPFRGSAPPAPFPGSAPGMPFPGAAPGRPFPGSAQGMGTPRPGAPPGFAPGAGGPPGGRDGYVPSSGPTADPRWRPAPEGPGYG